MYIPLIFSKRITNLTAVLHDNLLLASLLSKLARHCHLRDLESPQALSSTQDFKSRRLSVSLHLYDKM